MSDRCSNCGHEYGENCDRCGRMFACGSVSKPCEYPGCEETVEQSIDDLMLLASVLSGSPFKPTGRDQ